MHPVFASYQFFFYNKLVITPITFSGFLAPCSEAMELCIHTELNLELVKLGVKWRRLKQCQSQGSVLWVDGFCVQSLQAVTFSIPVLYYNHFPCLLRAKFDHPHFMETRSQCRLSRGEKTLMEHTKNWILSHMTNFSLEIVSFFAFVA